MVMLTSLHFMLPTKIVDKGVSLGETTSITISIETKKCEFLSSFQNSDSCLQQGVYTFNDNLQALELVSTFEA